MLEEPSSTSDRSLSQFVPDYLSTRYNKVVPHNDEAPSRTTSLESHSNCSVAAALTEDDFFEAIKPFGNFPVDTKAMEEAKPFLRIIRRKLQVSDGRIGIKK